LDAERLLGVYMVGVSELAIGARYCVRRGESLPTKNGDLVLPPDLSRRGGNIAAWRHPVGSQSPIFVVA
jgi:hypothetical protein